VCVCVCMRVQFKIYIILLYIAVGTSYRQPHYYYYYYYCNILVCDAVCRYNSTRCSLVICTVSISQLLLYWIDHSTTDDLNILYTYLKYNTSYGHNIMKQLRVYTKNIYIGTYNLYFERATFNNVIQELELYWI